ncbi:MAG: hypothetical protein RLZZ271_1552 [Pseudomonadota bacterium]|jgi:hypothetical protein
MTYTINDTIQSKTDRFGYKVAGALTSANDCLPHDITERLRAARVQALSHRKRTLEVRTAPVITSVSSNGTLTLGFGAGFWENMGALIPVMVLLLGMFAMDNLQNHMQVSELAEVDSALLTDDLPPAAYSDPGFAQFLKRQD